MPISPLTDHNQLYTIILYTIYYIIEKGVRKGLPRGGYILFVRLYIKLRDISFCVYSIIPHVIPDIALFLFLFDVIS